MENEMINLIESKGFKRVLNKCTHSYVWIKDRYVLTENDFKKEKELKEFLNSLK